MTNRPESPTSFAFSDRLDREEGGSVKGFGSSGQITFRLGFVEAPLEICGCFVGLQPDEYPQTLFRFPVPSAVPKVEGISFRTDWKWEVTDVSQVPREYMMVNEVAINGVVRAMKDKTNIPGVRVFTVQVTVKSRR